MKQILIYLCFLLSTIYLNAQIVTSMKVESEILIELMNPKINDIQIVNIDKCDTLQFNADIVPTTTGKVKGKNKKGKECYVITAKGIVAYNLGVFDNSMESATGLPNTRIDISSFENGFHYADKVWFPLTQEKAYIISIKEKIIGFNVRVEGSEMKKGKWKEGDIFVTYKGGISDGYVKSPRIIDVLYSDLIDGKAVNVSYQITATEPGTFTMNKETDILTLTDKNVQLNVQGMITYMNRGKYDTLATFKDILYLCGNNRFKAWVVSKNSNIGVSVTTGINKTGLHSSCTDMKFTGQKVAFYRIEKDFTLTFVAKPVSLETAPVKSTLPK